MVGKLFKHELADSYKAYVPVLGSLILGIILTIVGIQFAMSNLPDFFSGLIFLSLFGLSIVVMVFSIRATIYVLYSSLYGKNGYRVFTLPIKSWQLLVTKVLVSLFWNIIVGILLIMGVLVIVLMVGEIETLYSFMGEFLSFFAKYIDSSVLFFAVLDNVITFIMSTLILLFAGSVAHSKYVLRYRGQFTVIFVIVFIILLEQISSGFSTSFASVITQYSPESLTAGASIPIQELGLVTVYQVLVCGFLTYGTLWFWNHKLEIIA